MRNCMGMPTKNTISKSPQIQFSKQVVHRHIDIRSRPQKYEQGRTRRYRSSKNVDKADR